MYKLAKVAIDTFAALILMAAVSAYGYVNPSDLRTETVNGIKWSYVIESDLTAKVTNWNLNPAIPSATTGVVAVPDTLGDRPVKTIGSNAFRGVTGMTSLVIPDGVETIETYACLNCSGLKSVSLPSTLKTMGDAVFKSCGNLEHCEIPDSVTTMGRDTFWECKGMETVRFSENVTRLEAMTCYNCDSLTNVVIPSGVEYIGVSAFSCCDNLLTVDIPASATNIDNYAFEKCTALKSLELPDAMTEVKDIFSGCSSLGSIKISAGVVSITVSTFISCSALTNIEVAAGNASYKSVGGVLFNYRGDELLAWPYGLSPISIPAGVTQIGDLAFSSRRDFQSVDIPEGVESIGDSAFDMCTQLSAVAFPSTLKTIGMRAFFGCPISGDLAFAEGFECIGEKAFMRAGVSSLCLPSSTTIVGRYAFSECSSLQSLVVKSPECRIADWAFSSCPRLVSVDIAAGADVSEAAFGDAVNPVFTFWRCDFENVPTYLPASDIPVVKDHVVCEGYYADAYTDNDYDYTAGRKCMGVEGKPGDRVWLSVNETVNGGVGNPFFPADWESMKVSFKLLTLHPAVADRDPLYAAPQLNGGHSLRDRYGTTINVDDKIALRYAGFYPGQGGDPTNVYWQLNAGFVGGDGILFEQSVRLEALGDAHEPPTCVKEWCDVAIEAVNDRSPYGLGFRVYIGGLLARSPENNTTVFRARPDASDRVGVTALGFGRLAFVDDIWFRKCEMRPLDGKTIFKNPSAPSMSKAELSSLAAIVGLDALNGITALDLTTDEGGASNVPIDCVRLGITPERSVRSWNGSVLSLYFKPPTVDVTNIDPVARTISGRIVPAEGSSIVQPPLKYMFGLCKISDLGTENCRTDEYGELCALGKGGFEVDLSDYLSSGGEFTISYPADIATGESAFFYFDIKDFSGGY